MPDPSLLLDMQLSITEMQDETNGFFAYKVSFSSANLEFKSLLVRSCMHETGLQPPRPQDSFMFAPLQAVETAKTQMAPSAIYTSVASQPGLLTALRKPLPSPVPSSNASASSAAPYSAVEHDSTHEEGGQGFEVRLEKKACFNVVSARRTLMAIRTSNAMQVDINADAQVSAGGGLLAIMAKVYITTSMENSPSNLDLWHGEGRKMMQ